ncbi:hypothetical protein [Streptomyces sp. Rer75]|uniref:hypothetical protein n=1 Tax=Streptomyces sp. Rer75 TaxID=2750011 RepID=UPI0015CF9298|nr:hypothetical protein [Streptomyces sp. Rer75]QLH25350.1 hypothetical protein HYQ63_35920 [Streptomyces sp. Rer75]
MFHEMARQCVSPLRRWRAIRPIPRSALVACAGALVLFTTAADTPRSTVEILSAQNAGGYVVMSEPSIHPWAGTFGSYLLCVEGEHTVTIKRVRYETPVRPLDVDLLLREVDTDASVLVSIQGKPPGFTDLESGARHEVAGKLQPLRADHAIERPCGSPRYGRGFTELLFIVKVDQRGGVVDQMRIDYVIDGHANEHTLELEGKIVLCGDAVGDVGAQPYCDETRPR